MTDPWPGARARTAIMETSAEKSTKDSRMQGTLPSSSHAVRTVTASSPFVRKTR